MTRTAANRRPRSGGTPGTNDDVLPTISCSTRAFHLAPHVLTELIEDCCVILAKSQNPVSLRESQREFTDRIRTSHIHISPDIVTTFTHFTETRRYRLRARGTCHQSSLGFLLLFSGFEIDAASSYLPILQYLTPRKELMR